MTHASCRCIVASVRHQYSFRVVTSEGICPAVTELEASKSPECQAEGVWVDPSGVHHILLLQQFGGYETMYFHSKWKKAKAIAKLKGIRVTSVGWNPESCSDSSTGYSAAPGACLALCKARKLIIFIS